MSPLAPRERGYRVRFCSRITPTRYWESAWTLDLYLRMLSLYDANIERFGGEESRTLDSISGWHIDKDGRACFFLYWEA